MFKRILSYWDRLFYIPAFLYAMKHQMEAVAITFAILTIFGGRRIRDFILAIVTKLEQSSKGSIIGASWEGVQGVQIPLKYESRIDISSAVSTYLIIASSYIQEGKIGDARDMLEKAEKLDSDNYEVNIGLGLVYDLTHEYQRSIDYSTKALMIKPKSFTPQFNLAVATNHLYGAEKSLPEYLTAEELARKEDISDDITIGKLNLFIAHDYRDMQERNKALERYYRARDIFKGFNTPDAQHWLRDTNINIRALEGK